MQANVIEFISPRKLRLIQKNIEEPKLNEVLIRTVTSGICMREVHVFLGHLQREMPAVMGHEPVGIVEAVGEGVEGFKPGDRVTALGDFSFAEYFKTNKERVALIPEDRQDWQDWLGEPVMCAVNCLRNMQVEPGDLVVVIGCGFMGLLLLQGLLKTPAEDIIALDINEDNVNLAKKFGVVNSFNVKGLSTDIILDLIKQVANRDVDIVVEASGTPSTVDLATRMLRKGGKLVIFGHHIGNETVDLNGWHLKGLSVLNIVPWFSKNIIKDFHDGIRLLKKGVFKINGLITNKTSFQDAQRAMEIAASHKVGYIKGVLTFPI